MGAGRWRIAADWTSRLAFVAGTAVGWIVLGPPWAPKTAGAIGLLDSALVPVGAFVVAALVQRVIAADYALKAGPFELSSLEHAVITTTDVAERVAEDLRVVAGDVAILQRERTIDVDAVTVLTGQVQDLGRQVEYLEQSVDGLLTAFSRLYDEVTKDG